MDTFDVFIVGGGAAGSEVGFALADADKSLRIGIAERDALGGECTHYGCVPTKAMLRAAQIAADARGAGRFGVDIPSVGIDLARVQDRVRAVVEANDGGEAPFKRVGIEVFTRSARLVGPHELTLEDGTTVRAERIVLATGSEAAIPPIAGLADGRPWTNRQAIWTPTVVPNSLAIIGGGAIGLEFAQIYARFGARVVVIESASHVLPNDDKEVAASLARALRAEGIEIMTGVELERAERTERGWTLSTGDAVVAADEVLVAAGREPVLAEHDLHAAGVEVTDAGRPVLDDTLRTTADSIWVLGDATGELLFTHVANYEAGVVVDALTGRPRSRDYRMVPRVTFTSPEVASVGLTEQEATTQVRNLRIGRFDLVHDERSMIDGRTAGLVKIVATHDGEILGGHIVAEQAGIMIHEILALMAGRVPADVGGDAIHAYPTLSEAVKRALLAAA